MTKRKSKPVKKSKRKPARKKRGRVSFGIPIKKTRGHEIYHIELGNNPKTEQEIKMLLETVNFSAIKEQNEFVKVTFVENNGKEKQAYTDLDEYSYDGKKDFIQQLKQRTLDMNYTFHRVPAADAKDYWKKMYRLRNYLRTIIIDLETAD